jgi:hypothetical protein
MGAATAGPPKRRKRHPGQGEALSKSQIFNRNEHITLDEAVMQARLLSWLRRWCARHRPRRFDAAGAPLEGVAP